MSKTLLTGFAALALTVMAWPADQAHAIQHGCTPPDGIDDIVIDVSLGGRTSRASGAFCAAIQQAETMIAQSRVPDEEKKAAYATLADLQKLVASEGRSSAGKKVSGSVGCQGNVSTGKGGTSAGGSCGFTINF